MGNSQNKKQRHKPMHNTPKRKKQALTPPKKHQQQPMKSTLISLQQRPEKSALISQQQTEHTHHNQE